MTNKYNHDVYIEKIKQLYLTENLDIKEIAIKLNISYSTVYRILLEFDIKKSKELAYIHRSKKFARFDKEFWNKRNNKSRQTLQNKYGKDITNPSQIPGMQAKTHLLESIQKAYLTKKKNNTFNTSKPEEEIYNLLCTKFFNVERNYKSEKYPFKCDFYIPAQDLYIEYQGSWTHGFDGSNLIGPYKHTKECKAVLMKWLKKASKSKFYTKAIEIWTVRDPLKREVAKKNKLNWIEFFNMNEFENWFKDLH